MPLSFSKAFGWLLLLLVAGVSNGAEDDLVPRWRFDKGRDYKYVMSHQEVRTTILGDQTLVTTTTTELDQTWKFLEREADGTAVFELTLTGLRQTSMGRDFEFRYDSTQPAAVTGDYSRQLSAVLDNVRHGRYRLRLAPDGRVLEVSGLDKVFRDTGADGKLVDLHAMGLHDATLAWLLQHLLPAGPQPPAGVKAGAWKVSCSRALPPFGQSEGMMAYQSKRVGKEIEIRGKGQQGIELDSSLLNAPLRGRLAVEPITSETQFDPERGVVTRSEAAVTMAGKPKWGRENNAFELTVKFEHKLKLDLQP